MKKQKEKLGHQIKITAKDDDDTIIMQTYKNSSNLALAVFDLILVPYSFGVTFWLHLRMHLPTPLPPPINQIPKSTHPPIFTYLLININNYLYY